MKTVLQDRKPNTEELVIYREIVAALEDVVFSHDPEGRLTYINPAGEELLVSDLNSGPVEFSSFVAPEFVKEAYRRTDCQRRGEPIEQPWDLQVLNPDGTRSWIQIRTKPIYNSNGELIQVYGVARNIQARKNLEHQLQLYAQHLERLVDERTRTLRESEEKYRLLVEHANDAVFVTQNGTIQFPNPKATSILGLSAEDLLRTRFDDLVHPNDRDHVKDFQGLIQAGKANPDSIAYRMRTGAGRQIWVELNSVSIRWDGLPALLNFLREITEKKNLEQQLLQAQKMESIGTLAGGIAHDFNNLLMGIQGNVSLGLLEIDSTQVIYENLKNIEKYVRSASELTRQLLGFARGGKYEVKPTDLNTVIKDSASMFGRTRKEVAIHLDMGPSIWTVEVDRAQIEQVLLNLYVNAWQAMPGGGQLFLATENVTIGPEASRSNNLNSGRYVKITVADTGEGIDETIRQRIFDPFFTTRELGRGTGLGLASAYGIIKNHGGVISVSSVKGGGTTFSIFLPASTKPASEEKPGKQTKKEGREMILVVDDEELVINITQKMLSRMGYRSVAARSGGEAVDIYREQGGEIDLIILDMIMPEMSGRETYDQISAINPDARFIVCSGYSVDEKAADILNRGCSGLLQKPFDLNQLSTKIREVLDSC